MRHCLLNNLSILFFFFLFTFQVQAQFPLFESFLSQLDSTEQENFLDDFGNLQNNFDLDSLNQDGVLDDLLEQILFSEDLSPDEGFLDAWEDGFGNLEDIYDTDLLDSTDLGLIIEEYLRLDTIFNQNFDDFGAAFGNYQDSLLFDETDTISLENSETAIDLQLIQLQAFLQISGSNTPADGLGDFRPLIKKLLDKNTFPHIELAFGFQQADINYYGDWKTTQAPLVRIGSVPQFNSLFENHWHVQVSWTDRAVDTNEEVPVVLEEVQPLLLDGSYSATLSPIHFGIGDMTGRLVTSLGAEVGTYAPKHQESNLPHSMANRGFTTGLGVQAGAGFALTANDFVVYSLATLAYGDVVKCVLPYRYQSNKIQAGVRFKDIINIRYSTGTQNWAPNRNRMVSRGHEVTVGLILDSLHR